MRLRTLFEKYAECVESRYLARFCRRKIHGLTEGIAVDDDKFACEWQRRDRQLGKLERRLLRELGDRAQCVRVGAG